MKLTENMSASVSREVDQDCLASRWGSGYLDVFATPFMIAMMEEASCECVNKLLDEGLSTVGTHVDVRHIKATKLADKVTATAKLIKINDRELVFEVRASDSEGVIGEGTHKRFIVDVNRFMAKLG